MRWSLREIEAWIEAGSPSAQDWEAIRTHRASTKIKILSR
jgi:hypothetical protein